MSFFLGRGFVEPTVSVSVSVSVEESLVLTQKAVFILSQLLLNKAFLKLVITSAGTTRVFGSLLHSPEGAEPDGAIHALSGRAST